MTKYDIIDRELSKALAIADLLASVDGDFLSNTVANAGTILTEILVRINARLEEEEGEMNSDDLKRCGNCKHLDEHNEAFICNYFGRYINNCNVVNSVSACGRWELAPATLKPCPACRWHDLDMKGCANIVCCECSEFEEEK